MKLVLFDLDNTLLDGDSDYEWAQFLIEQGVLERASYEHRNEEFFEQYKAGRLDIYAFLDFQLAPLARYPRAQLDAWHRQFMTQKILPKISAAARRLVGRSVLDAQLCAIVTATNSFVTAPIAREFGVPHLVATEPEQIDGRFTGKVSGTPCFREGKVTRVDEWLTAQGRRWGDFAETWFYSDSHNDLPLLQRVTHPVAVRPDHPLKQLALERGWEIIALA
ncbi:MAG TPA: HAD family hydrolase [Burkholderiales bacterium]|nr:HAD family hydrolase [Burkholderiales bacterium]